MKRNRGITAYDADSTSNRSLDRRRREMVRVLNVFICCNCSNYVEPPMYLCLNGHFVCNPCRTFVTICPACRIDITKELSRAIPLERVAEAIQVPCQFRDKGCTRIFPIAHIRTHIFVCEYNPSLVPCAVYGAPACRWFGKEISLLEHLRSAHEYGDKEISFIEDSVNKRLASKTLNFPNWGPYLYVWEKHVVFLFNVFRHLDSFDFIFVLRFIGPKNWYREFEHTIAVCRNERKALHQGYVRPYSDHITNIIEDRDCLVLTTRAAKIISSSVQVEKDVLENDKSIPEVDFVVRLSISRTKKVGKEGIVTESDIDLAAMLEQKMTTLGVHVDAAVPMQDDDEDNNDGNQ